MGVVFNCYLILHKVLCTTQLITAFSENSVFSAAHVHSEDVADILPVESHVLKYFLNASLIKVRAHGGS